MTSLVTESWTAKYFDTVYLRRWTLGLPTDEVYRHVDFLLDQFCAARGDSLLDVGCGQGRYSLAFAGRGLRVAGLDASPVLLEEAGRLSRRMDVEVDWILGDMRALPSHYSYHHAILLDALGFFDTDEENEGVVHQMARVIRPNGWIVIAVANGSRILSTFEPFGHEEGDGRVVVLRRELDAARRVVRENVAVEENDRRFVAERRQRLYTSTELTGMAARAGLTVRSLRGDLGGAAFDEERSGKIVLLCGRSPGPA